MIKLTSIALSLALITGRLSGCVVTDIPLAASNPATAAKIFNTSYV